MIKLTRLNGRSLLLNADLIEFVEETPDCLITLCTGRKIMVRDSMSDVREKILDYRKEMKGAYPVPALMEDESTEDSEQ